MAPQSELKARLKELGMSQSGDKRTLELRIEMGTESLKLGMKTPAGEPLHLAKLAMLKKCAAGAGVSPIGTHDEILRAYVDVLKGSRAEEGNRDEGGKNGKGKAKMLSERVLVLDREDDFLGILKLGGGSDLTASSSVGALRKAYLKLSLVLHPDKNRNCGDATRVFQAVVNAFERVSQPELVEDAPVGKGKKKAAAISRSNSGCKRTRVCCPRCKSKWSETSVEGNPDYFYNFMMTGIKSFTCATCLLEFGCMTATHKCPFCNHCFEYHPSDFHRKITCGSKTCDQKFGFYMFHCSDRVLKNLKIEAKESRERKAKITDQKRRRAESFKRRRSGRDQADEEAAFLLGLADECPRCGISLSELEDEDEMDHLRNCNDAEKITSHKRKKEAFRNDRSEAKRRQVLQEDVAAKATWDLLGASNENMWLLTDGALQNECAEQGVAVQGKETHQMIAELVRAKKTTALTKFSPKTLASDDLPSNLHSMTLSQLKAVAASHGITLKSNMRKVDIVQLLQPRQDDAPLMLTSATSDKKTMDEHEVIQVESGSESEYDPDE